MADRYIRSIFWLFACTGLGVGLLTITKHNDSEIEQLKKELPGIEKQPREVYNKNQQFLNVLQAATNSNKPLYRMSKEEIDREIRKQ